MTPKLLKQDTLVLGLEHFIDKIGYQAEEYRKQNIRARYIVMDKSGFTKEMADKYKADVVIVPSSIVMRLYITLKEFICYRPKYVELYDTGKLTVCYACICKLFFAKLIIILRGTELQYLKKSLYQDTIRKVSLYIALIFANIVVAKEFHILNDLSYLRINQKKVFHLGNCVPTIYINNSIVANKDIDLLYLNSIRRVRNVEFMIRVFDEIIKIKPQTRISIVGFTSLNRSKYLFEAEYEKEILNLIDKLNLNNSLYVGRFTENPHQYFLRAKIFVLPANTIYANYSLLESMSYGVIPVVANGEGAGKIIEQGVSGFIVERSIDSWVSTIIRLLENEKISKKISDNAKQRIITDFNIEVWVSRMKHIRSSI